MNMFIATDEMAQERIAALRKHPRHLPEIQMREVFHTGRLDINERTDGGYEGTTLSVTRKDLIDNWRSIARIGGHPVWRLAHPDESPIRLLDLHQLRDEDRHAILDHCENQGWIQQVDAWRIAYYDDEMEMECYECFLSEEEAQFEAEDGLGEIEPFKTWTGSTRLDAWFGPMASKMGLVESFALMAFAREELGLDGVWWEDQEDLSRLSSPRGALFDEVVKTMKIDCLGPSPFNGDESEENSGDLDFILNDDRSEHHSPSPS